MTKCPRPIRRATAQGVMKLENIGRPFLCHYWFKISLSDQCSGVEKKILKNWAFSLCAWLIWPCPRTRTPAQGVMKFENFSRSFLVHNCFILTWSESSVLRWTEDFKINIAFKEARAGCALKNPGSNEFLKCLHM